MSDTTPQDGDWPLKRLMTEVVGSGHKSAEDMDRARAMEALQRILDGQPDPTTLGAFWLANRWKRNTPEELAGFVDVMREESVEVASPSADPVDCGANYDGKHTTAILGVASGIVAAAAGTPVVVHSGDRVPTQKADAYKHVLDEIGVETDLDPGESADLVDDVGFGFYYQPNFNPGVDALVDRRDQMGVRTFVNTIETLSNPADATVHLGSFYHLPFAKRMVRTLAAAESQPVERALFFQGMEGYDDVRPGTTVVAEWPSDGPDADGEGIADFEIRTSEYGVDVVSEDLEVDDVAVDSAAITEAVVAGDAGEWGGDLDTFAGAVHLNAALRMYAREDVASVDDGMAKARRAIEDGSAAAVLSDLRDA
jgi:anthranilate phosphoribosyltransferase